MMKIIVLLSIKLRLNYNSYSQSPLNQLLTINLSIRKGLYAGSPILSRKELDKIKTQTLLDSSSFERKDTKLR